MLVMVVLTVFIAGLMVGRTPEYLGKKIQAREVQMAMLYALVFPAAILTMTAVSTVVEAGTGGPQQHRPARAVGDPLRVLVDRRQQRQRVRRPNGHDLLLQHDVRSQHAHRPVRDDRADAGARRLPRREESGARVGRDVSGHDAALRGAARLASF